MTEVAESAHGICVQPLQAPNWSGVSGASLAPKSTVRPVIALMPPLEPIALYWRLSPNAEPTAGTHCATSGATNVLPAPVSVVLELPRASATDAARPAATATSTAVRPILFIVWVSPL